MIKIASSTFIFIAGALLSKASVAAICITCTQGGGCMTYSCGTPPFDWGFDLLSAGVYVHNSVPIPMRGSPLMSSTAHIQKTCSENKGRIQMNRAKCRGGVLGDNIRETERCNQQNNLGWDMGFQFGYLISFGTVTRSIENPTFDKCINMKEALRLEAEQGCESTFLAEMTNAVRTAPQMCFQIYGVN